MINQVLSIEQMKHLQELGVDTSKATMCWKFMLLDYAFYGAEDYTLALNDNNIDSRDIPTFTLQDMLEMISNCFTCEYEYKFMYHLGTWYSKYMPMIDDDDYFMSSNTNLLTCAYETLCWLVEKGLLKGGNNENK